MTTNHECKCCRRMRSHINSCVKRLIISCETAKRNGKNVAAKCKHSDAVALKRLLIFMNEHPCPYGFVNEIEATFAKAGISINR